MCLAIVKPIGVKIKTLHLKNGWESNDHGAGLCYPAPDNSEVVIKKGFFKFDDFIHEFKEQLDRPMLVHFRWATHGLRDATNTHPWPIIGPDGKVWYGVIHNGIISNVPHDNQISDTGVFTSRILAPILLGANVEDPAVFTAVKTLVEDFLGAGNKVAIMDRFGRHTIFNESSGSWDRKCWWSNTCYLTAKSRYPIKVGGSDYEGYSMGHNYNGARTTTDSSLSKATIDYHIKAAVGADLADEISARATVLMESLKSIDQAYIEAITEIAPVEFGVPLSERKQTK